MRGLVRRTPLAVGMALVWLVVGQTSAALPGSAGSETPRPYQITDGRVDKGTYSGYRLYNAVCNHCHGPDGAGGSFAPSLIQAPMSIEVFRAIVLAGSGTGTSVMPGFADDPNVAPYVDAIFAYLRARADGAIGRGRPAPAAQP